MAELAYYEESDFVTLSSLQHFIFCPRQCALIHLEQIWVENAFTAEGREMHELVDKGETSYRAGVKITRSLSLKSRILGLSGVADVVEWHHSNKESQPFPVEYKRGKPKGHNADKIQLCAQALCLEEMLSVHIPAGALFYGQTKHRMDVPFDSQLRDQTINAAKEVHDLIHGGITPMPEPGAKCKHCSLLEQCMPDVIAHGRSAKSYLQKLFHDLQEDSF
ncbi:MAG TPA: CRISPR-associated protein Cas4 [Chlorobium sp.]|uniref:CRISPR-associated exonuclease Cas4 n=1 Tax=Chlorobium phaeovibrioides (strain DSM 265 / 1930) TaxID=290318 RepID=A4SFQ7_CHLPM|nr:CRISPR-associated protein Cas4 [Chlorobium phaeovibrioides]HCD36187.1 CRISPR-associated protein Cas4 [Chlorobium sp.]